jgi:hypothetical protein
MVLDINLAYSSPIDTKDFDGKIVFPKDNTFLEEAGFHLYLKLLEQGFPKNLVIFLTSNVDNSNAPNAMALSTLVEKFKIANQRSEFDQKLKKGEKTPVFTWLEQWIQQGNTIQPIEGETVKNTYEDFVTSFKEARLIPPDAFDKKRQDCSTHLQNWLWNHCECSP